mgnify:FL=1
MLNLTLTTTTTGSNFLDETAAYLIETHGYRAESFEAERLAVTITGDAADLALLCAEADATLVPCADEIGVVFYTDAACLALLTELVAAL